MLLLLCLQGPVFLSLAPILATYTSLFLTVPNDIGIAQLIVLSINVLGISIMYNPRCTLFLVMI